MPETTRSSELEEAIHKVASIPEPDAEFLNTLRANFLAKGQASGNTNQQNQIRQKSYSRRLTWGLVVLAIGALAVLFTRPGVVSALKRLFGYVPNVGIIDRSSEVRMLAESVTVTRENYTVTVEQAVLNSEMAAVVYSYTLPPDMVIPDAISSEFHAPFLTLPDGTRLDVSRARHVDSQDCPQCYLRYLMEFPAIPSNVNEATLELPDLAAVPSNTAPCNWRMQLRFKPADPSAIAPVFEQAVTPVPATLPGDPPTNSASPYGIMNRLDTFVALPDGYILFGNTSWTDPVIPPYGVGSILVGIQDASGAEVPFDYADPRTYSEAGELRVHWAYEIGTNFTAPLTLTFGMTASLPADEGSFTFDPGPNPQLGQKWELDQEVTVNQEVIHILGAEQAGIEPGFFLFTMQSDSNIIGASIVDLDHPPIGGGGGGGGLPEAGVPFYSGFGYQVPIPQGPLTFTFTRVEVLLPGDWTLTWGP